ncbi:MAG: carboxyl transferase domain-containing protein, partial [Saprospiraceae bacterium]|nr:carboxyl transferase domain-containing protein [Saprospiraceae bacterium]
MRKKELDLNKNEDHHLIKIGEWQKRLKVVYQGGGKSKIVKHHSKGKMTARERIEYLVDDPKEVMELGAFAGYDMYPEYGGCPSGGVVTVVAKVSEKMCVIIANDATVKAGAWFPITG